MQVFFCITCKGRTGHLARTLPQNLKDNKKAKFVLVDYSSQDHLEDYIRSNHQDDFGKLTVYRFTEPGKFRMAHAKNLAHRLALREGADILVNLDADNFTGLDFDQWIIEHVICGRYAYTHMKKGILDRGVSGRIAITKHQYYITGGYDEIFKTWSPDDKDFNMRLKRLGYTGIEIPDQYLKAIKHNDKLRFREYPEITNSSCSSDFALDNCNTIRNYGQIGLGVVYRNFNPEPIVIDPIPTRIFGVGWHKTATTSLSEAIRLLGYGCDHWKSAHWAKTIWTEMTQFGKSITLEQSYGITDVPICLLYKELDQQYPGSKFILTVREENEWLRSVEDHFSNKNPFRKSWNKDPFSHKIHKVMYGQKTFDRDIFLQRYRKHNTDVIDYFKDRLLIMDMTNGSGWFELCGFLKQRIPPFEYPKLNRR